MEREVVIGVEMNIYVHTTIRKACGSSSRSASARSKISKGSNSFVQTKKARLAQAFNIRSCKGKSYEKCYKDTDLQK
jgi:hypothetical protein